MNGLKKQRVLPAAVICIAAIVIGWWSEHTGVSDQDKQYYTALLCTVVAQSDEANLNGDRLTARMRQVVENGNNDYALNHKQFNVAAAREVLKRWQQLNPADQGQARQDPQQCRQKLEPSPSGSE